jgi:hypothetical protein
VNRSDPSHWILDQAPFFFEHAERIAADGYEPDTTDLVKTRVLTVGINTVSFIDEVDCAYLTQFLPAAASLVAPEDVDKSNTQLPWQMIDVGGQRGERRKWMSALDDVLCLVYTVGLIEYQQIMYEDTKTVRSSHARLARRTFVGCPPCALAPRAWLYACVRASESRCATRTQPSSADGRGDARAGRRAVSTHERTRAQTHGRLICVCRCVSAVVQIRMKESLSLFMKWGNNKSFTTVPVVLAFTKKDVFEATWDAEQLKRAFPEFDGSTSADGLKFITRKFEDLITKRAVNAPLKVHVLNTTNEEDTLTLLNEIRQMAATHRSDFLMSAVQNAVNERATKKNKRGSSRLSVSKGGKA